MSPRPLENLLGSMVTNAVGLQPVAVGQSSSSSSAGGGGGGGQAGGGAGGSGGMGAQHNSNGTNMSTSLLQHSSSSDGSSNASRGGSISLAMLFDFIIQRTYHELTQLAEILPSKSDMERKIEIHNFSARTRQLFIRLLALVKWANSASKVDKSSSIMKFLDKQSMLFIDTADMLARMARETLVNARLPNYHIQAAVEVLTTGNYARLPACIREKIIPIEPITALEKKSTLQRLNQVIQQRLVAGGVLPQMSRFRIADGRVTFRVEHEFEVALTLMGDGPVQPWRLLDIDILVEDRDTGGGKPLVHPQQVAYIQQFVQAQMTDTGNVLEELYTVLHYFCQSLQLEVLFTQTLKLQVDRLDDDIEVDEYIPGERLTVAYWCELAAKDQEKTAATESSGISALEFGFQLTVQTDPHNKTQPLQIKHLPSLGEKEAAEVADHTVRSDVLSMERLLVHTIYIRSLSRLADVRAEFQTFLKDVDYHLQGTPAILTVPVLHPCLRAEQIHITVDTHTGRLRCHVPKHLDCPVIADLERALNDDHTRLPGLVSELRYWITLRRCEKTLQHLPASPHDRLPLLHAVDHPIARIGRHRLFVRFNRHPTVILVVQIAEKPATPCEMDYNFYLAFVRHAAIDDSPLADDTAVVAATASAAGGSAPVNPVPKVYLRVQTLIEFDTFVATHGPGTTVSSTDTGPVGAGTKHKLNDAVVASSAGPPNKQTRYPSYFVPELAHIVNSCDEKLPFMYLTQELESRGIPHCGLQTEANVSALVLKLLHLPQPTAPPSRAATAAHRTPRPPPSAPAHVGPAPPTATAMALCHGAAIVAARAAKSPPLRLPGSFALPIIGRRAWASLQRRLLTVAVRSHPGVWSSELFWSVEYVFNGTPLRSAHAKEQGQRRTVTATLPGGSTPEQCAKTVDQLMDDWRRIVYLYCLVDEFVEQARNEKLNVQNISIRQYNYTSLLIGYGRNREVGVKIFWCNDTARFRMVFSAGSAMAVNAHFVMREQLQAHLNTVHNLAQLVHVLNETYEPLASLARLAVIPHLGILPHLGQQLPPIPVLSFCVVPQSATTVRVVYQLVYCLEICFRGGGLVSIRDGAHSRFAKRNVLDEYTPTQGLHSFLSKYVDETTVYRRRSPFEDDNPPSPAVVIDEQHGGPGSVGSVSFLAGIGRGAQSPRDAGGLRFTQPMTPPSISQPMTPASPHHSNQQQQQQQQRDSLSNNFGMTSPPSMPHPSPSGGANMMPASPLNPLPSPAMAAAPSPGPGYMQQQQQQQQQQHGNNAPDSSPFNVMSPAGTTGNWPGSPGMPRPSPRPGQSPEHKMGGGGERSQVPHVSRVLPARSWAGATPTLLTDEALEQLCRPGPHPQKEIPGPELCPLERFLGCCFMRKQLLRFVQADELITNIQCEQQGVVLFRTATLHCQVFLNPQHHQSLHLKLSQLPVHTPNADPLKPLQPPPPYQWSPDDMQVIERFFDSRVVMPPYRWSALLAFSRMLTVPLPVLRDFIQIMRLELMPELLPGLKWHVHFCMRSSPSALPVVAHAVVIARQKILFFLQITRIPYNMPNIDPKDLPSLILPIVYDVSSNITQLAERSGAGGFIQSSSMVAVSNMLRRFAEYSSHQSNECSIFPAVRDLLMNLMPNEPPQMAAQTAAQMAAMQQQQQQHQMLSAQQHQQRLISPAMQTASPGPMMHSPMPQQQQQQMQQQQQHGVGPPQGYGGQMGGPGGPGGPN